MCIRSCTLQSNYIDSHSAKRPLLYSAWPTSTVVRLQERKNDEKFYSLNTLVFIVLIFVQIV